MKSGVRAATIKRDVAALKDTLSKAVQRGHLNRPSPLDESPCDLSSDNLANIGELLLMVFDFDVRSCSPSALVGQKGLID